MYEQYTQCTQCDVNSGMTAIALEIQAWLVCIHLMLKLCSSFNILIIIIRALIRIISRMIKVSFILFIRTVFEYKQIK